MPVSLTSEQATALFQEVSQLKTAYQLILADGPASRAVLLDLARFCRGDRSCWDPDPRIHAALEGRREVWLRIQNYLHLSEEDLLQRRVGDSYQVVTYKPEDDTDD